MKPISTLFITFLLILGLFGMIYHHEFVHKEIFRWYNIDNTIDFGIMASTTTSDKPCPSDECILAHNINDIITYPVMWIYILLMIIILIIWNKE